MMHKNSMDMIYTRCVIKNSVHGAIVLRGLCPFPPPVSQSPPRTALTSTACNPCTLHPVSRIHTAVAAAAAVATAYCRSMAQHG